MSNNPSSDRKQIFISPDLFKIPNKTRKKTPSIDGEQKPIKIKSSAPKNNKTSKGKILRYIREQQEKHYKQLMEDTIINNGGGSTSSITQKLEDLDNVGPPSEFDESINYLKGIIQEHEEKKKEATRNHISGGSNGNSSNSNNYTFKNHNMSDADYFQSLVGGQSHNTSRHSHPELLPNVTNSITPPIGGQPAIHLNRPSQQPAYGCLKGGNLPTYRTLLNKTQKSPSITIMPNTPAAPISPASHFLPQIHGGQQSRPASYPGPGQSVPQPSYIQPTNTPLNPINLQSHMGGMKPTVPETHVPSGPPTINIADAIRNERLKKISEIRQTREMIEKANNPTVPKKMKYMKQKKTIRRTYRTGKSKVFPRVSVLVSNKTIRKKIATDALLLKQTPIQDVKKYLIQKGFIKVGSTAPNDVLRKIYESTLLVGGEIQNHNPENLLHNYLNADVI